MGHCYAKKQYESRSSCLYTLTIGTYEKMNPVGETMKLEPCSSNNFVGYSYIIYAYIYIYSISLLHNDTARIYRWHVSQRYCAHNLSMNMIYVCRKQAAYLSINSFYTLHQSICRFPSTVDRLCWHYRQTYFSWHLTSSWILSTWKQCSLYQNTNTQTPSNTFLISPAQDISGLCKLLCPYLFALPARTFADKPCYCLK